MRKFTLLSALFLLSGWICSAYAQQNLKILANDDNGNVIDEAVVPFDGALRFAKAGVNILDADNIPVDQFSYSDLFMLTFMYEGEASVGSLKAETKLRLRQNPVAENLEIIGLGSDAAALKIFDAKGANCLSIKEWKGEPVNVSSLSPGIYFVTVNKTPIKFIKR